MYAAPVISGGALLGPTNVTTPTGTLPSQLTMNRNRATGVLVLLFTCLSPSVWADQRSRPGDIVIHGVITIISPCPETLHYTYFM